jgi:hypothetical protein
MDTAEKVSRESVPCRVYIILARAAPVGVVFRRGPTKWVQVLKWNTQEDSFDAGQWFNGRIYERRCDLSPDGTLLVYFASKFNARTIQDQEYTYAWTAISKPPYLTALALWPKGDCWHDGGLFEEQRCVWLNHKPEVAIPHPQHQPKGLRVKPNPTARGEDYPVWSRRLQRDGWKLVQKGNYSFSLDYGFQTKAKMIWERAHSTHAMRLRLVVEGINFIAPGGYIETFWLLRPAKPDFRLVDARWADWDQQGRLVFVREGKLLTGEFRGDAWDEQELIDLNANTPYALAAPEWAKRW